MTDRTRIPPRSKFEAEVGFTRALRVGDRIVVAGTVDDRPEPPLDAGQQADRCYELIASYIEELGGTMKDVVRVRMFVTDISYADAVSAAFTKAPQGDLPHRHAGGDFGALPSGNPRRDRGRGDRHLLGKGNPPRALSGEDARGGCHDPPLYCRFRGSLACRLQRFGRGHRSRPTDEATARLGDPGGERKRPPAKSRFPPRSAGAGGWFPATAPRPGATTRA